MTSDITSREVGVRLYLNGFPKAGTHILAVMASLMLKKAYGPRNWLGNTTENAFGRGVQGTDRVLEVLDVFDDNVYIKGHLAYDPKLAESFQRNRICKVFIFRDFRDVAVSAAHHAAKDDGASFPEKKFYQSLDFDERLRRIIVGDETIAGVMERWEMYAPWLDEDWVLKLTYEDYIEHKKAVSGLFVRYVYGKSASYRGLSVELDQSDYEVMLYGMMEGATAAPKISPTYRHGSIGEWKEHFTEEHKRLFKESDKNNWLVRLGYADDRNW